MDFLLEQLIGMCVSCVAVGLAKYKSKDQAFYLVRKIYIMGIHLSPISGSMYKTRIWYVH